MILLIIASGTDIHPEEVEGMLRRSLARIQFLTFIAFEGSVALRDKLRDWRGGKASNPYC